MDPDLIKKALCFHGKPMQKIWDDERGSGDLKQLGVPEDGDYAVYMARQKFFTFQDRAKRLKLHQFLARKATDLYDSNLMKSLQNVVNTTPSNEKETANLCVAQTPSYEILMSKKPETKSKILRHSLESIEPGDIVYAIVVRARSCSIQKIVTSAVPIIVKPLCTAEPHVRLLHDCNIKAYIPGHLCGPLALDKLGKPRPICTNDYVCCEIVEFSVDAERMTLSLEPIINKHNNVKLGLTSQEELPQLYRKTLDNSLESYEDCLRKAREFENPNYDILYAMNGLDVNDTYTLMSSLKCDFPRQEYARELRQVQASKWAFRSVAEGIEYFKVGQHVEAFQCLNRALNIDPRNVEGLVARGALYANKGSFLKAVEDFEKALKLNAYHVNARKYMGETLVALGRSYEEDNRIQDAAKAYRDCLNIIPNHEQARLSLEAIQQRTGAVVDPPVLETVYGNLYTTFNITENENPYQPKTKFQSPPSSTNESNASESSTESEGDSSDERHSHQKSSTSKKAHSLSPLSKKMALHSATLENSKAQQVKFNQPFYMTQTVSSNVIPNEFKLDDDDTGSRVRRLLQEASKHKKEKRKSKKKKSKKSKKESKNHKEAFEILEKTGYEEAYKLLGGGTQHIENKLNENLKHYEQTIAEIKRRQEELQSNTVPNSSDIFGVIDRQKSETPPEAPSMRLKKSASPITELNETARITKNDNYKETPVAPPPPSLKPEPPKFSFQIKKPVKVDKFGLVRLVTPALPKSPTISPERPTRRSRSRRRSVNRHRSRTRSRSRSYNRHRKRSKSRSRSPYTNHARRSHRRRSPRSRSRSPRPRRDIRRNRSNYRRSPSPYITRSILSPRSHHRRSRSPRFLNPKTNNNRRSSHKTQSSERHANRTWQRPGYKPQNASPQHYSKKSTNISISTMDWLNDKFENTNDGPSIEEIDEIINRAQKERKEEIIKRDKHILKKPTNSFF